MKTSWLITVPKGRISDFIDEINHCQKTGDVKKLRIPPIKKIQNGDMLYVVYDGTVRGRAPIISCEFSDTFTCTTTGNHFGVGYYIICELSAWEEVVNGAQVKGFQGVRKYETA